MSNFFEKLNLTTNIKNIPDHAFILDTRRDIAVYDTLCLYCAENNIDLVNVSDEEFYRTSETIENYLKSSVRMYDKIAFWFDL